MFEHLVDNQQLFYNFMTFRVSHVPRFLIHHLNYFGIKSSVIRCCDFTQNPIHQHIDTKNSCTIKGIVYQRAFIHQLFVILSYRMKFLSIVIFLNVFRASWRIMSDKEKSPALKFQLQALPILADRLQNLEKSRIKWTASMKHSKVCIRHFSVDVLISVDNIWKLLLLQLVCR